MELLFIFVSKYYVNLQIDVILSTNHLPWFL